ncbi:MAG: hypothetical protein EBU21_03535 [Proteobacteria bacterium]|jgi:hypothetical protein|nr:hypothetical protein [Pseudomonadota bacterium]
MTAMIEPDAYKTGEQGREEVREFSVDMLTNFFANRNYRPYADGNRFRLSFAFTPSIDCSLNYSFVFSDEKYRWLSIQSSSDKRFKIEQRDELFNVLNRFNIKSRWPITFVKQGETRLLVHTKFDVDFSRGVQPELVYESITRFMGGTHSLWEFLLEQGL